MVTGKLNEPVPTVFLLVAGSTVAAEIRPPVGETPFAVTVKNAPVTVLVNSTEKLAVPVKSVTAELLAFTVTEMLLPGKAELGDTVSPVAVNVWACPAAA